MAYPITYSADFAEDRSRLTTFFRILLVIPHVIVFSLYAIVGVFTIIGAWFAVVATGRYPQGLYSFNAGLLRYLTRMYGYMYLVTDAYPPFGTGEDDSFPVRLHVAAPKPQYSRLKAFFRIILAIPVFVIFYVMNLVFQAVSVISWFWIVVTGRQNSSLQGGLDLTLGYIARANGYLYLLTEDWPPISNEPAAVGGGGGAATLATPEAPTASERPISGSDIGLPDLPPPPRRDDGPDDLRSGDPLR